jgi:hypothetical protein
MKKNNSLTADATFVMEIAHTHCEQQEAIADGICLNKERRRQVANLEGPRFIVHIDPLTYPESNYELQHDVFVCSGRSSSACM